MAGNLLFGPFELLPKSFSLLPGNNSRTRSSHKVLHPFHFSRVNTGEEASREEETTNDGKKRALWERFVILF